MTTAPVYVVLVTSLAALSVVDVRERRLPRRIVHVVVVVSTAWFGVVAVAAGTAWPLARAVTCGAVAFVVAGALHAASPSGLGFGDVRVVGLIGLDLGWLGVEVAVLGLLAGLVLAAAGATLLVVLARRSLRDGLPLGPFLATGAMIALVAHV